MNEVLAKGKRTLLIIGAGHLETMLGWGACISCAPNVRSIVEATYPKTLFVIQPHFGLPLERCDREVEAHFLQGPKPALTPLQDAELETLLNRPECRVDNDWGEVARAWGDAYLYLGKSEKLTLSPYPGDPESSYLKLLKAYLESGKLSR